MSRIISFVDWHISTVYGDRIKTESRMFILLISVSSILTGKWFRLSQSTNACIRFFKISSFSFSSWPCMNKFCSAFEISASFSLLFLIISMLSISSPTMTWTLLLSKSTKTTLYLRLYLMNNSLVNIYWLPGNIKIIYEIFSYLIETGSIVYAQPSVGCLVDLQLTLTCLFK